MKTLTHTLKSVAWLPIVIGVTGAVVTVLACQAIAMQAQVARGAEIATLGTLGFGMMLSVLLASIAALTRVADRSR